MRKQTKKKIKIVKYFYTRKIKKFFNNIPDFNFYNIVSFPHISQEVYELQPLFLFTEVLINKIFVKKSNNQFLQI